MTVFESDPRAVHALSASILTTLIGLYPLVRRRDHLTRLFAASNISLAVWNLGDVLVLFLHDDYDWLLFGYRLNYLAGITTGWLYFQFMYAFTQVPLSRDRLVWQTVKWVGILLIPLALTPLLVRGLDISVSPFKDIPGPGYPLFILFLGGGQFFSVYRLVTVYRAATGTQRRELGYMLLALVFILAEAFCYFASLYFEALPPHYFYLQVIYAAIIAYAIVKHHLLGVAVFLKRTFVYSGLTILLTTIYTSIIPLLAAVIGVKQPLEFAWPSAATAAVIAVLFLPLRMRIGRWLDRRFRRESLDQDLLREATSGFVHEIKRPLANISIPAQLALQDVQAAKEGKIKPEDVWNRLCSRLEYIVHESMDAGEKMEALRDLSSTAETGHQKIILAELIDHTVRALERVATIAGTQIDCRLDSAIMVMGNPKQLEMAIGNLIKNAVEAAQGGAIDPNVTVVLQIVEGRAECTVQDTGQGIQKGKLERIFEPYFSTKGHSGTGIGLSLAREVIRLHGGNIRVVSNMRDSTSFIVSLPIAAGPQFK
jgi:signal transduction histidine kinase